MDAPPAAKPAALTLSRPHPCSSSLPPLPQAWARTPLWRRAELLHRVAALMRENAQPMADVLVKEVAKPAADAYTGALCCERPLRGPSSRAPPPHPAAARTEALPSHLALPTTPTPLTKPLAQR